MSPMSVSTTTNKLDYSDEGYYCLTHRLDLCDMTNLYELLKIEGTT